MEQPPNYRRRRIGVALAALSLLVVANHDRPRVGTLSIDLDGDRMPRVAADLAPPLDAVVAAALLIR